MSGKKEEKTVDSWGNGVEKLSISALPSSFPTAEGFIYDILLKMSVVSDDTARYSDMITAALATAVGHIIHKHEAYKDAGDILFKYLWAKLQNAVPPKSRQTVLQEHEFKVSISGSYFGPKFIRHLPMVYDCIMAYCGLMEAKSQCPESIHFGSIVFKYDITVFFTPALKIASRLYDSKGFAPDKLYYYDTRCDFSEVLNLIKHGEEYNATTVWNAAVEQLIQRFANDQQNSDGW